tara:strand:- start:9542 stop:10189 length:648 start_codon:yes stop_codon:yes gene_type:complete
MARKLDRDGMFYKNRYTFVSVIVILGMYFIAQSYYDPSSIVRTGAAVVAGEGTPDIGGEFSAVNHKGQPFTEDNLQGKYSLVFFGFTHCPDICPTALSVLSDVYTGLSPKHQSNLQVIMASVDPLRDTVETMGEYVPAFHESFIGLTGTEAQMKEMAKAYLVYFAKHPADKDGNYTVDHSGYIYLIGPDGRYVKHFSHKDTADDIRQSLQSYLTK